MNNFFIMSFVIGLTAISITPVNAGLSKNQRVEIPIYSKNVPFLDITVGHSAPLSMFIDTGAGGIRIHPGNLGPNDVKHTGQRNRIMYGDGNSGIEGEVVLGKVKIGDFTVPGETRIQAIDKHVCKPGFEQRCERDGSKHGGAGTIGLGTFHYADLNRKVQKDDAVFNPLIQQGPFTHILKVPHNDSEIGALIINPTGQEKARFTRIALTPGMGKAIPICINRHCFDVALDTGTVGNHIPMVNKKDAKLLGLQVEGDSIATGTKIPIVLGSGRNTFALELPVTAKGAGRYTLKDSHKERGVLGIDIFRYIDVLYDFEAGVIGIALKQ